MPVSLIKMMQTVDEAQINECHSLLIMLKINTQVVINMNFMFFTLLHYFTVSLTGSAFKERSSSSADVDGYDKSG